MGVVGGRLRSVDLARVAGVSTQQIRNYEDAGVLPRAERSPAGYRWFTERHRRALGTFYEVRKGFGAPVAQAIMRAVHDDDLPEALNLVSASHAALHEQRLNLKSVGEALELIARQDRAAPALPRTELRIGEVAAHLGVRPSALRVWESAGLLTPQRVPGSKYRTYRPADVRDARMISMLRQARYPLPHIRPILDGLRERGSSDALRAAVAERLAALTRRATAMLAGASHLHRYVTGQGAGPVTGD